MRNVIVTGGSRGLGLAIAGELARRGFRVVAIARRESEQLRVAMAQFAVDAHGSAADGPLSSASHAHTASPSLTVSQSGRGIRTALAGGAAGSRGTLHFRAFDLMDTAGIGALVANLRHEFGPIYGLVNNAGLGTAGVLTMMRDEQIEGLTRLNLLVPMILSKYVVRSMMVERAGRIVNVSSIVASTGYMGLSAYGATKAALIGFTRSLAREVGQLGVTVNAVAPGFVATEMTEELNQGQREQIMRRSALRRMAEADDVAAAVEYLMSERARNITGITLTVDAGNSA